MFLLAKLRSAIFSGQFCTEHYTAGFYWYPLFKKKALRSPAVVEQTAY